MLRIVGLVLYAVLVFFGLRGMSLRQAAAYCLTTALLLTLLSAGAMGEPSLAGLALAFFMTLALAILSFGGGATIRRFLDRTKNA